MLTFGHGTLDSETLAGLIRGASIGHVLDVRTTPKSRRHPWVWREELERWIPQQANAEYRWCPALGGRRRPSPASPNVALRHPAFRGYADYMQTGEFLRALRELAGSLSAAPKTAIMCSETLWWRCHRRLISDAATLLYGVDVRHLDARGKTHAHAVTPGARVDGDILVYDVAGAA